MEDQAHIITNRELWAALVKTMRISVSSGEMRFHASNFSKEIYSVCSPVIPQIEIGMRCWKPEVRPNL